MFKVPAIEDKSVGTGHHAPPSHHPIPVPVSSDSDSTLPGEIVEEKAKDNAEVRRGNEKPSLEDQEQSRTRGSLGDEIEEFPEGGLKAWTVVLGSFLALVSSLGIINTIGMSF